MADKQDELNLPIAVVTRIIKDALPEGCNVAKEAKLALTRAASIFVLYLTAQANHVATERNKKTISDADVLEALRITEFGKFEDELKYALEQYKNVQKSKKEKKNEKDNSRLDESEEIEVEEVDVEMTDHVDVVEDDGDDDNIEDDDDDGPVS